MVSRAGSYYLGQRDQGFRTRSASLHCVMDHHPKFEGFRFIGDKRTQLVYDLTTWGDDDIINDIANVGVGLGFGPDTLAEARNRGYTLATPGKTRRHRKPRA
jgi:hypothetical protein